MRVNKTVSMDLDLLNQVMDEAEEMGKDFSASICVLVRIGIAGRANQRERERTLSAEEQKALKVGGI